MTTPNNTSQSQHSTAAPDGRAPQRILLGVTGGVAAYKAPELVRRLAARGCQVQVVMTRSAGEFTTAVALQAVSGRRVREDLWDPDAEAAMGHIELARWADIVLVAPATANFIGLLAHGLAGDLLSTVCLATTAPIVLAPSMNRQMWANPAVRANWAVLAQRGVRFIGPAEGEQACGEHGLGRMAEPDDIAAAVLASPAAAQRRSLPGLKVIVTAGPTREPIDPVRYITNRSSGRMGYAIAAAAREAGADVTLISGPVALDTPPGVQRIDVETAQQMYEQVHRSIGGTDVFIACAAVSDYRPQSAAPDKIKRSAPEMKLDLVRSPDTLASVAALTDPPFTVGFAAETRDVERHARDKLERKGVDMIAANRVGPDCGFDRDTNELVVYWRGGEARLGKDSKAVLAQRLLDVVAERYREQRSAAGSGPHVDDRGPVDGAAAGTSSASTSQTGR
jgi:phosphopantothenoylcysteine decarboxylase/phosphopantothenate--cysteine ligase